MKRISDCTLMVADTYNYGGAVASLKKCMQQCEFTRVIFFTNIPIKIDGIEVIQIDDLRSKDGYSHFMIKELWEHITTNFVLVVQHDSWILDGEQFDERLYEYDYAGALWLESDGLANGNGGFSWRSRKLLKIVANDNLINATSPEDVALCRVYRRYLEKNYNLFWASDDVCEKFSFELRTPMQPTFGFHSFFHEKYQPTVVVRRWAAMGDVIQVEPLLKYFHDNRYRVVLDTLPQFHLLFLNHYFKVYKLSDVDQRLINKAKIVNLDMSYESNPKQLHLKTYFEYAGVPESEYKDYIKSPQLNLGFSLNRDTKVFAKYAIIHTDNREQPSRNIYGVDWEEVVWYLQDKGYTTIQVGRDDTAVIPNATRINCTNENFLSYVVGGADMMIGIDSGISHIASGFKVPSIILSGSVDIRYLHPNMSNIIWIHNHEEKICDKPFCWHSEITTVGVECYVDKKSPPCSIFKTEQVIKAIDSLCN